MAIAAQKEMNQKPVGNNFISVQFAHRDKDKGIHSLPSNNVYVCNLPPTYQETDLYALFSPYGGITSLIVLEDRKTGMSKCAGLIRFNKMEEARNAVAALNGMVLDGHNRPLEVKYAESSQTKELRHEKSKGAPVPVELDQSRSQSDAAFLSNPSSPILTPMTPHSGLTFDGRMPGNPPVVFVMPVLTPQLLHNAQPPSQSHRVASTVAVHTPQAEVGDAIPGNKANPCKPLNVRSPAAPPADPWPGRLSGSAGTSPAGPQLHTPLPATIFGDSPRTGSLMSAWEEPKTVTLARRLPPQSSSTDRGASTPKLQPPDMSQRVAQRRIGKWEALGLSRRGSSAESSVYSPSLSSSHSSGELSWEAFSSGPCSPATYLPRWLDHDERFSQRDNSDPKTSAIGSMAKSPLLEPSIDSVFQQRKDDGNVPSSLFDMWTVASSDGRDQQPVHGKVTDTGGPSSALLAKSLQEIFGPFQSMFNLKASKVGHPSSPPPPSSLADSPLGSPLLTGTFDVPFPTL
eukprot:EG_transcript_5874